MTRRRALGLMASPLAAQGKKPLAIATSGIGTATHVLGGRLAELISRFVPGVTAAAELTPGLGVGLMLLHTGRVSLAFSFAHSAWEAAEGKLRGLGTQVPVRAIAACYAAFTHIVVRKSSDIRQPADLKGRRVATGFPGGGTDSIGAYILEAFGIRLPDLRGYERVGPAEWSGAMKDRKIDAIVTALTIPSPVIVDLASTPGIELLDHGEAIPTIVARRGPFLSPGVIPRSTYKGITRDVSAGRIKVLLFAHARMEDQLAYQITRVLLEHAADLADAHRAGRELTLRSAVEGCPVPFHPRAMRYYREKGML